MSSLVFFHAHPDDEALATGGTIAQATAQGHFVTLVFATRGEVGEVRDGFLPPGTTLGEIREAEARAAAEILGVQKIEFLNYEDSGLENTVVENPESPAFCNANPQKASQELKHILDEVEADLLTAYDPNGGYGHPDHIQVHRVGTLASEIADKTPRFFWATMNRDHFRYMGENNEEMRRAMQSETESPDRDGWLEKEAIDAVENMAENAEAQNPVDEQAIGMPESEITHFINILPFIDQKIESIRAHNSQIDEDSMFLKLSKETQRQAFGTEWFVIPSLSGSDKRFTDLFEG